MVQRNERMIERRR